MRRWVWLMLTLGVASCNPADGPRELPFPDFDPDQPVPELGSEGEGDGAAGSEQERAGFEDAIRRAGGATPEDEAAGTQAVQTVPLASILLADIPVNFDEWQYSSDGVSTLITHRTAGNLPDAMIYIEAFSAAVEFFPSYEVGRFQFTVDPGLSPNIVYPPLVALGYEWAKSQTAPPLDVLLALQMATTRTMGMGLGYSSSRLSFTGWKWVGETRAGLEVRFGRSSGRWDTPAFPGQREAESILKDLVSQAPAAQGILDQIQKTRQVATVTRRPPSAAWMLIGSARRKNNPNMGVHIAVVCERRPVCPVALEVSQFLASLRPVEEGANVAAMAQPLSGFAQGIGVNLLEPGDVISAPKMISILQQALRAKQLDGAKLPAGVKLPGEVTLPLPDGSELKVPLPEELAPATPGAIPIPPAAAPTEPVPQ